VPMLEQMTVSEWPQPTTPAEWQNAVDTAAVVRLIAKCRQCGFIKNGPIINMDLCDRVIEEGRRREVKPSADPASRVVDFLRTLKALHDPGAASPS
jgi:hypothetical protein